MAISKAAASAWSRWGSNWGSLPWQVPDTQRYLKKMAQLGYTI
jgi:hypothetical protein